MASSRLEEPVPLPKRSIWRFLDGIGMNDNEPFFFDSRRNAHPPTILVTDCVCVGEELKRADQVLTKLNRDGGGRTTMKVRGGTYVADEYLYKLEREAAEERHRQVQQALDAAGIVPNHADERGWRGEEPTSHLWRSNDREYDEMEGNDNKDDNDDAIGPKEPLFRNSLQRQSTEEVNNNDKGRLRYTSSTKTPSENYRSYKSTDDDGNEGDDVAAVVRTLKEMAAQVASMQHRLTKSTRKHIGSSGKRSNKGKHGLIRFDGDDYV